MLRCRSLVLSLPPSSRPDVDEATLANLLQKAAHLNSAAARDAQQAITLLLDHEHFLIKCAQLERADELPPSLLPEMDTLVHHLREPIESSAKVLTTTKESGTSVR